jgi:tRNA-dihydrouridine synthase
MKYYLAPLEGVTTINLRNTFEKYFHSVDKYYIPFLEPHNHSLKNKQEKEILPINNKLNHKLVPQIISKDSDNTIWLINKLAELGYDEVNLNFGCPSRTVTTKSKGSGILDNLELLDKYLNDIFNNTDIKISIKMRLGLHDTSKFKDILNILNKYDILELIIHPRTGDDQYIGNLKLEYLDKINELTNIPIIYNGECNSHEDIEYIKKRFPFINGIMLGRGLLERPFLLNDYDESVCKESVKSYYHELATLSINEFGWGVAKFYLKQLLVYLIKGFDCPIKLTKKLFKSSTFEEFDNTVLEIFNTCPIKIEESGIKKFL